MRPGALVAAVAATLAAAACGAPSPDLFVVKRSGSIPGARLTLVVGDGGTVTCNGGPRREITSAQLIDARAIVHDLAGEEGRPGPALLATDLAPGPSSILRYAVRTEHGSVAFSDTSRDQPAVFYEIARLTRELAKTICRLPR